VPGVPTEILQARNTWADKAAYDAQAAKLAYMFAENFKHYADGVTPEVATAGPIVPKDVDTSNLKFSKPGEG
jgi:phosphoenolpyruvate carboxykinase (ATP)